jgi:hypothetical protein
MRVRMTTNIVGTPTYKDGQIVDLEERIAKAWIEENYCVPVGPTESKKAEGTK